MTDEIKKHDVVQLEDGSVVRVTGYNKGWFTGKDEDGEERKFRAKKVVEVLNDESEDEEGSSRNMSKILQKYAPGYQPTVAVSGRKSLNNGDTIADLLAGMDPDQIIWAAERILGLEAGELAEKYDGLNRGQKRMNAGNRIRAAIKRGDLTMDEVYKQLH